MSQANKMMCPDCGAEMNHHADKIDFGIEDPSQVDPVFGGVVEEAHACPKCGRTQARKAH